MSYRSVAVVMSTKTRATYKPTGDRASSRETHSWQNLLIDVQNMQTPRSGIANRTVSREEYKNEKKKEMET